MAPETTPAPRFRRQRRLPPVTAALIAGALACGVACGGRAPAVAPRTSSQPAVATPRAATVSPSTTPASGASVVSTASGPAPAANATVIPTATASVRPTRAATPPPAGTVDACRLVTQQEAEASAGEPLGLGRGRGAQPRGVTVECAYQNAETGTSVTVSIHWAKDASGATTLADRYRSSVLPPVQDVPGLGDRAFFSPGLRQLYVLQGNALVGVQLVQASLSTADSLTRLTQLATLALSRL